MSDVSRVRVILWGGTALCVAIAHGLLAQTTQPETPAPPIINQSDDPLLKRFVWRSIGPAVMGGRIDDIAVHESDPSTIYLGYATGGIWKTHNNGTTWTAIFDEYPVSSIGDVAIAPSDARILYVGTGEPNNRQSSSFGAGVYKSVDGGKSFAYSGLDATQTIARIVVHPKDPNIAYVAAVGHLFGPNPERGIYKTTNGGSSWERVKFVDNDTGFIDMVMHPTDPDTLWAASYQRRRVPWGFNGGGPGSGIWKTTNAGRTWTRLTGNGLPEHAIIGRIGLDISRTRPNVLIAQIEVGPSGGTGAGVNEDGSLVRPGEGQSGGRGRGSDPPPDPRRSGIWRSDDGGRTWKFLSNTNNRPMYYSKPRIDPGNDQIVYTLGATAMKSVDGGKTFRPMIGPSHGDHHALWINPRDSRHLLLGNDGGLDVSYDRGETWEEIANMATGQFYAISADMRKPYYVCGGLQDNGSWCGPSAVRSNTGILNTDWYRIGGGDGFYTQNDPIDWTTGYGESQDGNTFRYDLRTGRSQPIRPRAAPPEARGGAQPNPEQQPPQGGGRGGSANVVPAPPAGTTYRFYWNTPFVLSPHDPRTIYLGGDRLFTSATRGDTWTVSVDLTRNIGRNDRPIMGVSGHAPMASKHDGAGSYSNIVTLAESPVVRAVLWVGTNDGNVQISRDGGKTWKNVVPAIPGVPDETHVSRVEPSRFDAATCYVTFDGHRMNDHTPYVFVTRDFGETWTSLAANLPTGNVNIIREDPRNRNLLYLGTEYAFYISLNGGKEWKRFMNGLPTVRIDDVIVHPRDNDLILGTHGRSLWIIDDITPLQQLNDAILAADVHLFDIRPATRWTEDLMLQRGPGGAKHFRGQNPSAGTAVTYYLKTVPAGDVRITVADMNGTVVRNLTGTKEPGLNRVQWNLAPNPPPSTQAAASVGRGAGRGPAPAFIVSAAVPPGPYVVKVQVDGSEYVKPVAVEDDPFR